MANNSVSEILEAVRAAEISADTVRSDAADIARRMIADAAAKADVDFEAAMAELAEEKKNALEQIRRDADALVADTTAEVRAEADRLRRAASDRRNDTADYIFREISKKCQQA